MIPHVLAFALSTADVSPADTAPPPRTTMTVHGIGGPLIGVTQLGSGAALLTGGRGGVLLDRRWFFGLDVEGTPTFGGFQSGLRDARTIGYWQVAGLAEVSLVDHARIHPRLGVALGGAFVDTEGPSGGAGTFALVTEPTGTLELTVSRFLRLGATAGYRFAMPTTNLVTFAEASGVVGGLCVQLGFVD